MDPVSVALGAVLLVVAWKGIVTVPQDMAYTIERFGKYRATFTPGSYWLVPYVDRIGHRLSMLEQAIDVPAQTAITRGNMSVRVDGAVSFQILDAAKAAYNVQQLDAAIAQLTATHLRAVVGSMNLDQLPVQRDRINGRLLAAVGEAATPWGIKIIRVGIEDIRPPADLASAIAN